MDGDARRRDASLKMALSSNFFSGAAVIAAHTDGIVSPWSRPNSIRWLAADAASAQRV
ncbi:hypothetical protein [Cryptosporangium sp. NPDC051539]|uniref:hypothetical protein n=1 Tax=Cryptosporangium sp. NPDC051539 TaxID=3363962 RepID=UPI00379D6874